MRLTIVLVLASTLLLSQVGCSFLAPSTVPVTISCNVPGAQIHVDGVPVGTGTVTTLVSRDFNHTITAKIGERSGTVTLGYRLSALGILDIIGGILWLVPLIGLAAPGSRVPDSDYVNVVIP